MRFTLREAGGGGLRLLLLAVLCGLSACTAYTDRIAPFRKAWHAGDIQAADRQIDVLIAGETDVGVEALAEDPSLATRLDCESGNTVLYALEKAATSLALTRYEVARTLLQNARSYYDQNLEHSIGDAFASLGDDESRSYVGNDYEHLLLRVYAGLTEMMEGGEDAIAHMMSMDEVQERILSSDYGEAEEGGYKPRERYRRLMIGSYFAGVLFEGEAQGEMAYQRFKRAEQNQRVPTQLLQDAIARTEKGEFAPFGSGALHVVYFGGRGPYYVEGSDQATDLAVALAGIGVAIAGRSASAFIQASVPVPVAVVEDPEVPPLTVRVPGQDPVDTELICELNEVVTSQLDANMPWIMARAIARRAIKAAAAAATEQAVSSGANDALVGFFAGLVANVALTAGERAETRSWTSVPAQVQAARIVLPEGVHRVELSDGNWANVRIARGRNSFLLVFRPNLLRPGFFVVDKYSVVEEPEPEPGAGLDTQENPLGEKNPLGGDAPDAQENPLGAGEPEQAENPLGGKK
jgi:hypothetical protein